MSRSYPLALLLMLALFSLAGPAKAVIETYEFSDPALEKRYRQLSTELRCPKCQNQNIADSNSPIAQDLRKLLHQQLEQGASDEEILDYMVARYGEFVRYKPRFEGVALMLWLAPLCLLFVGVAIVIMTLRSKRTPAAESDQASVDHLSDQEQQKIKALLDQSEQQS